MEEALIKRILPHSIEAEQSVIGSMLMGREAIMAASEILTSDDFYQHQRYLSRKNRKKKRNRTKSRVHRMRYEEKK